MPATKGTSTDEVLEFVKNSDERFVTTAEVADAFDSSLEGARYHLKKLHSSNQIKKKSTGNATAWWCE